MKHLLIFGTLAMVATANAQSFDLTKLRTIEKQLEDVMEIIDTSLLKSKLTEVESAYLKDPLEINKVRLGIIYHEVALNLSFFTSTAYKGYASKSYATLSEMFNSPLTSKELMPFVASYRASALSLVSAETRNLSQLGDAFKLFNEAVKNYAAVSYLPEFLRGSVAENLPWFFFSKRKFAKEDFLSIIVKQQQNPDYANAKIMSFTYWAWARQHQNKKYRQQSLSYLEKAISLDPEYKGGRKKAEELKSALISDSVKR